MNGFTGSQVFNGTWGEVWIDDQYMAEVTAFSADLNMKYSPVSRSRHLIDAQKMTGIEGKGTVKFHKVGSTIMKKISDMLKKGKTPSFKIISNIDDPDAVGNERIVCYDCKFDKAALADWESGKNGEESYSFTFEDWDILDSVTV